MSKQTECPIHGLQGFGLVCSHIAHAVDSGERVGFYWGDDTDTAWPDAWCHACERALLAVPPGEASDRWFVACEFNIFCARCWDHAKSLMCEER